MRMEQWWDRLDSLMRERGLVPADLARRSGVAKHMIYKYLDGKVENPRGDVLHRLARAVGVPELFLRHGAASVSMSPVQSIPMIKLASLGQLGRGEAPKVAWDGETTVAFSGERHDLFAFTLEDDSGLPDFRAGEAIICEPTRAVDPGDYVLVAVTAARKAYFGRYSPASITSADAFRVIPTNALYPSISIGSPDEGYVIARAISHIRSIK